MLATQLNYSNREKRLRCYILVLISLLAPILMQAQEKEGYLFSYFDNVHEDAGLCLAYSYDGYTWVPLNEGKVVFKPEIGKDKLLRDPSICQGPDGTFHMVWTSSWTDQIIGYASSQDLIHWSQQRAIPVMKDYPTARNSWAPELFFDKSSDLFYILWSSTVPGSKEVSQISATSEDNYNHRIYYTTTRDFQSFSPTQLYFNPDFIAIDASVVQVPETGELLMAVKNENLVPEEKNIRIARSSAMSQGFSTLVSSPIHEKEWCEGPAPLFVGNDLLVFYDKYRKHQYGASRSQDHGYTWEDVTPQIAMPVGMSHGTAFKVATHVIENLRKEYEQRYTVILETTAGNIVLQLYNDTPLHRDNLLQKIAKGTFTGRTFNRVISGFVIQCGEEQEEDIIPAEIHYPQHFHKRGVLAMGRCTADEQKELRSADEQFYICWGRKNNEQQMARADSLMNVRSYGRTQMAEPIRTYYQQNPGLPALDGSYTIFGEVVAGLDVVERIQAVKTDKTDRPLQDIVIQKVTVLNPFPAYACFVSCKTR